MKVLACGGRTYSDNDAVARSLAELNPTVVIVGGAFGADSLAANWAQENSVPVEIYPADWKRYGKAAGPIRNQTMLYSGKPDVVVAFPGGKGTADMIRRAKEAGVRVIEVPL